MADASIGIPDIGEIVVYMGRPARIIATRKLASGEYEADIWHQFNPRLISEFTISAKHEFRRDNIPMNELIW